MYDKRQDYLQKIALANRNASAAVMKHMQSNVDIFAILQVQEATFYTYFTLASTLSNIDLHLQILR